MKVFEYKGIKQGNRYLFDDDLLLEVSSIIADDEEVDIVCRRLYDNKNNMGISHAYKYQDFIRMTRKEKLKNISKNERR